MPKYRVTAPNGKTYEYEVPDGVSEQEVISHAQEEWGAGDASPGDNNRGDGTVYNEPVQNVDLPASSAPQMDVYHTGENWHTNTDGTAKGIGQQALDTLGGVAKGIATPFDNAAGYLAGAFGQEAPRAAEAMTADLPSNGLGEFLGNVAATAPLAALPGGALVQGAAGGALLSQASDAKGVAIDAAMGAAGGAVGAGIARAGARVAAPQVSPQVRTLLNEDIRLTPGQMVGQNGLGRTVKQVEDIISTVPIIGRGVANAQRQGVEDLSRATVNRALRPIGERLPRGQEAGHDAIAYAGDRLREAYNDVLPRLSGQIDRAFSTRIQTIRQRANLPPEYDGQLDNIEAELSNAFTGNGPNGLFTGRTLRDTSDRLDKLAAGWRANTQDPYLRQVGEVAEQMRQQLHALARRQNPADSVRLRNIDRGYASLVRAERAALNSDDGVTTPLQYKAATRAADRSARRRQTARGEALDQDLSSAAAQVMPNRAAQGGSKDVNSLIAMAAAGAGALGGLSPTALAGVGAGGAAAAAYSEPGLAVLRSLMGRQAGPVGNNIAALLRYGAQAAPIAAPAAIQGLRN